MMPSMLGSLTSKEKIFTTFDPGQKSGGVTLTNNNLTATGALGSGIYRSVYLKNIPTAGLWAIEYWASGAETWLSNMVGLGARDSYLYINTLIGATTGHDNIGYWSQRTNPSRMYRNSSAVDLFYYANGTTKRCILYDFTNNLMYLPQANLAAPYFRSYTFNTGVGGTSFIPCAQTYHGASIGISINTGQTPFSTELEQAMVNYENTYGVSINRGMWI